MSELLRKNARNRRVVATFAAGSFALCGCSSSVEQTPQPAPTATEEGVMVVDTVDIDGQTSVRIFSTGSAEIATKNRGQDYLSLGTLPVFLTCVGGTLLTSPESWYGEAGSGATITEGSKLCAGDGKLTRADFELPQLPQ